MIQKFGCDLTNSLGKTEFLSLEVMRVFFSQCIEIAGDISLLYRSFFGCKYYVICMDKLSFLFRWYSMETSLFLFCIIWLNDCFYIKLC